MDRQIASIRAQWLASLKSRTLLVFGAKPTLRNIWASGGYGFLHDMLDGAGGDDVFADIKQESVQATTEMILVRRPAVIVELRYGDSVTASDTPRVIDAWNALGATPAVRDRRVHVLIGDEFVTPGPRVVDAMQRLARTLHPELR